MAKGENIFKRKDGRWEARYIKGYDLSGKIKYGFCYGKTYKEAKEKVSVCKASLINGMPVPEKRPKHRFSFYCDAWLQASRNHIKESTYIKYDYILEHHIKRVLGECFPLGITNEIIEAFTEELVRNNLSPKTVKDVLAVLRAVLKYTARFYPGIFPMFEITCPKETRKEMRVLSKDEQMKLVQYLLHDMDSCKFGTLLALSTGLRIGEICALQWNSISLSDRTLCVSATMQRLKKIEADGASKTRVVVGSPKSNTSARIIPMTEFAAKLCQQMDPHCKDAFILTGTTAYMEPRTLQYRLKKYTDACGLEGVHFHTLRHTFATRCVEVGFEIKSLSEILGHSTTTITLDRYVHASIELKRDNMKKLSLSGL